MSKYETTMGVPTRGGTYENFISNVLVGSVNECWEWLGAITTKGYGCYTFEGKTQLAHRISYFLHMKERPNDKVVMHTCDNPKCVNPVHLILGTQADNVADMINKGRASFGDAHPQLGSKNGMARLNEDQVREIKKLLNEGYYHKDIADWFNVARQTITNIATGRRWSHI